ncbi:MAG: TolC family protein [Rhodothermales bacterium]|nr:TolC family protein [Rhodothermales bacterium]
MKILLLLLFQSVVLSPQQDDGAASDSLTLAQAQIEAQQTAPARSEFEIQRMVALLNQQNISTAYFPEFSVIGQAVYNSEVAEIPFSVPGQDTPSISNDQYKLGLSIEQLIFDGGSTGRRKNLEQASLDYANQTVAVSLYSIRQNVERSFFGALIAQARLRSLRVRTEDLLSKLEEINALVDEGVLTTTSVDQIRVEVLSLRQQVRSVEIEARTAIDILGQWMGRDLPPDIRLVTPDARVHSDSIARRPEFRQFELARAVLDRQDALQTVTRKPRVTSFGEVAYGRAPGLNLFENSFKPYFSLGVRLRWAAWDWNRSRNGSQIIQLKKSSLDVSESQFELQLNVALSQKRNDIQRLQSALEIDDDVITLRQRIRTEAESRFDNGIESAADYVREVNAEQLAILARELHRIELSKALVEYHTIQGKR